MGRLSKVAIVDFGTGNLNSVKRALDRLRAVSIVSSFADDLAAADKIILPGVGHFGRAMANLRDLNLLDELNEAVLIKRKPILGICLGMELMARTSDEAETAGLGWFDAAVVRFEMANKQKYKVPHMGWNKITTVKPSDLMKDVPAASEFYFAHSYYFRANDRADILSESRYEITFTSAVERDNIIGVQYHPEKSHDAGALVLNNFLAL